jgi:hypothetical protein
MTASAWGGENTPNPFVSGTFYSAGTFNSYDYYTRTINNVIYYMFRGSAWMISDTLELNPAHYFLGGFTSSAHGYYEGGGGWSGKITVTG